MICWWNTSIATQDQIASILINTFTPHSGNSLKDQAISSEAAKAIFDDEIYKNYLSIFAGWIVSNTISRKRKSIAVFGERAKVSWGYDFDRKLRLLVPRDGKI